MFCCAGANGCRKIDRKRHRRLPQTQFLIRHLGCNNNLHYLFSTSLTLLRCFCFIHFFFIRCSISKIGCSIRFIWPIFFFRSKFFFFLFRRMFIVFCGVGIYLKRDGNK